MGNTFGHLFRITTWGESHGGAVGVVVDGCPPRLALTEADIQAELDRRRPGQSRITTQRQEEDVCHILSGVFAGQTLGTPISILVWNTDAKPQHYAPFQHLYRPSHADYAYDAKYGIRNWQGGGRASARETIGRVAAGAIAKKLLREQCGTEIVAYVKQIHKIYAEVDPTTVTPEQVEANIVRCPDPACAEEMIGHIEWARRQGDSLGGVVEVVARQAPAGLGVPVFDKLEADLAKALMSLPASKGLRLVLALLARNSLAASTMIPTKCAMGRCIRGPITLGVYRAGFLLVSRCSCASLSSPPPPLPRRRKRSPIRGKRPFSKPRAVMIRACCHALCPWWKPWWRSSWRTTTCVNAGSVAPEGCPWEEMHECLARLCRRRAFRPFTL